MVAIREYPRHVTTGAILDMTDRLIAAGTRSDSLYDALDQKHGESRHAEAAVEEGKHRLWCPDTDDDPAVTRRELAHREAAHEHRQLARDEELAKADFALDAAATYAAAAPPEPFSRPTTKLKETTSVISAAIIDAVDGAVLAEFPDALDGGTS